MEKYIFKKKNHFCTFLNGMFMSDFFKNQLNGLGTLRGKVTHCFLYPEFTQWGRVRAMFWMELCDTSVLPLSV